MTELHVVPIPPEYSNQALDEVARTESNVTTFIRQGALRNRTAAALMEDYLDGNGGSEAGMADYLKALASADISEGERVSPDIRAAASEAEAILDRAPGAARHIELLKREAELMNLNAANIEAKTTENQD